MAPGALGSRWPSRAVARGTVGYGAISGMWRSLVSAPALGAGGRRFESGHPDCSEACQWRLAIAGEPKREPKC